MNIYRVIHMKFNASEIESRHHHHHHHHVLLLEVDKRNQHGVIAQYDSLIVG